MSGMRLRDSIRAPLRYGEDEYETPSRTTLRPGYDDSFDDSIELGESGRPRPQKRRKPNTVPFNPNLPPAAFPSLSRPQPSHASPTSTKNHGIGDSQHKIQTSELALPLRNVGSMETVAPSSSVIERVPMDQLDNHVASNNMDNPIYARNVNMARTTCVDAPPGYEDMATSPDSDDDPLPDATQVLLDAIPNPKWGDLHKAMQVEIVENTMKYHSWRRVCDLLGLGPDERKQLMQGIRIRNKQIERENGKLEQMRCKQRKVLMKIDNSDLKRFQPPPQLVLKRITRETNQNLLLTSYTDLLMCQAHEVLKARQYLHQHGLPRRYAGNWGDSLVVLRESEDDSHEPDKFEWKENLRFSPPPNEIETPMNPFMDPISSAKRDFIQSIGMNGTMNPTNLVRRNTDPGLMMDWGRYYERNQDSSWDTTKPRLGGIVKVNVGPDIAAQINRYEQAGVRPQGFSSHGQVPAMPGSPPSDVPQETPSKPPRSGSVAQPVFRNPARPFSRVITGNRSSDGFNPSESHFKYQRSIQQAKLEKIEAEAEAMRRRYNYQPTLRVNGVGVGISPTRGNLQTLPLAQPVEQNIPSRILARAYRGMTAMNVDRLMDEFVCYEPILIPEQSEPEKPEEEQPDEQPSSTDISSITEMSMDDVMLVPTDGCSSSE
ncbi:hypothetical protein Pdw03_2016 [Penicillium digitatum]|uniref:Uncharacterized protein n=3 Tax=Penicillium digitatum TaxID=36651 RepID=K9FDB2_PEND2|nr:hypothetical protein PDIP_27840 [Penicillium digitatum Pd1]EKV06167.1 hypothetical protein PDIG_79450 [Penicillium digitatum PHI26]EKV18236.1 hypothetical protein PDIP_27840 [Penicillium digitatum Pd1]KAG0154977.1 hypothetical protein PDIDSM_550 [Penicillium digitatum]QQK47118.1 hypothetical protein Pdw03_2016 [Penicillium digitatum]